MAIIINKTINKGKYLWAIILGLAFNSTSGFGMNKPVVEKSNAPSLIEIKKAPESIQTKKMHN